MTTLFLHANALLYAALAAWCTLAPTKTSAAIGFEFKKASAKSEYVTVYGGLELGLALFFFFSATNASLRPAGVLFAVLSYSCLALYRIGTIVAIPDVGRFPLVMLAIELPMALVAAWLYLRAT